VNNTQRHEIAKKFNANDLIFIPDDWRDNISTENANPNIMNIFAPSDDDDDDIEITGFIVTAKFFIENGYIADDAYEDDGCDRAYELLSNAGIDYGVEAEAYISIYEAFDDAVAKYNDTGAHLFTPDTLTAALKDYDANCTYEDLRR
jgi:hypothetical protein